MNSASPYILTVTEDNFEREVLIRSQEKPVVVDFWAPWCQPCRMLAPILEKVVEERGGEVYLAKVNVDDCQDLAMRYSIEGIPAVKAFKGGQVALEFVGMLPEAQLRMFLDQLVPTESDRQAATAKEVESSSPAEAVRQYREILAKDPNHVTATLGMVRGLIATDQDAEAKDLIDNLAATGPEGEEAERLKAILELRGLAAGADEGQLQAQLKQNPKDAEARYRLGCRLAAQGKHSEALATFLAAAEEDRKVASELVRPAMVKVFHLVGVRSELADEYRDKLMRLLY